MMNASLKGRYDTDTDTEKSGAAGTLALNGGDVKLRASFTDATLVTGPSLNGLSLSLEKPGSFLIDYNVPKKDIRFQFMNTVRVLEKSLNLTYSHARGDNRTAIDGTLVFDSANKLAANYAFDSGNCKLKYTYVHAGLTTIEPCYDVAKNSWDFAMSQRVYGDDMLRASYQTSTKVLGLDWSRNSTFTGTFKILFYLCSSMDTSIVEEMKYPIRIRHRYVLICAQHFNYVSVDQIGNFFFWIRSLLNSWVLQSYFRAMVGFLRLSIWQRNRRFQN